MSNNTSNYQEYTFSNLLEQYDKILVPMIQRDYAQGRTDKKATDVRNNLLTDIFSDKDVHFDLVFGSNEKRIIDGKEMNCFIPVDGQQRLTTLFLLFLYGQKAGKTNTELNLSKFSYDTRRAASDFCKSITSEEWTVQKDKKVSDVIKDSSWFMNYWEKDPTVEGMLNMLDAIHEKCKEITDYPNLNKVTFFFFDLESNGLNENLYLKMNSRGKPLTAFENLKSKIEKLLRDTNKVETKWFPENNAAPKDSFKEKWKFFMDRDWAIAFWDKDNPSKYDVNIAKFIVRFLSGYWAAFGQESEEKTIAENLKVINKKEENDKNYADYIQFEPIEKVLKLDNAFPALAYALTIAPTIKPYWSKDTIKVSDKSEYKLLSVIFTYILFDGVESAMRFAWNMAENYVSEYDNFVTYCKRAGEIYKFKHENNIATFYESLSNNKFKDNISDQLKEEIAKAKQILNGEQRSDGKTWEEIIIEAEKYAFFKGAIRFLFTKESIGDDWGEDVFNRKWNNAKAYFKEILEPNMSAMNKAFDNAELLKALISRFSPENFWKLLWHNSKGVFNNNDEAWRYYLLNDNIVRPIYQLMVGERNILECKPSQDFAQNTIYQLSNTKLLDFVIQKIPKSWIYQYHGHKAIYPSAKGVFLDSGIRDRVLINDMIMLNNEDKVPGTNFLYGSNIFFQYKQQYYFIYYSNNTVCLMNDNWEGKKLKNQENSDTPENNFYFSIDEKETKESFLHKLDCLIAQAFPDTDKSVCLECNEKICESTLEE